MPMSNRAYSLLQIKAVEEDKRVIRGVATTPEPDRMGDVVMPLGVKFKNPMPLLHHHVTSEPVGTVRFDKPTEDGITFEAKFPKINEPASLRERIETAWAEVKLGLVRGVSIGFRPINQNFEIMKDGGIRFVETEVLELSLVSVPANSDARITEIKQFDVNVPAATGHEGRTDGVNPPGDSGHRSKSIPMKGVKLMSKKTYAEQISAFEATRAAKSARMEELMEAAADKGETLDEAATEEYDGLATELKAIDAHLVRLREAEKINRAAAKPVDGGNLDDAGKSRGGGPSVVQIRQNSLKGLGFVQLLAARFMSKEDGVHPSDVASSKGWSQDIVNVLKVPRNILAKAAIAPANTTDSTWAAPLVIYQNLQNEFIELLAPKSVIARIPGLRRVPFNIKVPRETGGTTAYWVGQGSPKPVSKGALDTVTLDFAKVAGITFQTQELLRFSQPNSEQLLINSLVKAITYLVDRDFLDPAKAVATGVSPASITNGSTSITASGLTADAFRADFARLLALYTVANYSLDGLVIVMTQTQALRLGLMRNDFGNKEFPDLNKDGGNIEGIPVITSENIVANGGSPADGWIIVALNASDILLADDGAVDIDISTEASIQADSAPDSPSTASTVLISLWQNNLVGIRCERFITWVKARTDSVVYITGGNYGVS